MIVPVTFPEVKIPDIPWVNFQYMLDYIFATKISLKGYYYYADEKS